VTANPIYLASIWVIQVIIAIAAANLQPKSRGSVVCRKPEANPETFPCASLQS
jgi:hypothetical protein